MIRKLPREQRNAKRGRISLPVKYSDLAESSNGKGKVSHEGTTADLSENGLGLYSDKEIKAGTVLEIECLDIWESPRRFVVRRCHRIDLTFYRLGLELLK